MTVRADKTPRLSDGVRTRGGVVELSKTLDLLQILAFMMTRSFRARLDSIWFGLGPMSSLFNEVFDLNADITLVFFKLALSCVMPVGHCLARHIKLLVRLHVMSGLD